MSRPGLSMWGKEGEPMTPQERAAVYKYHRVFDGYNFLSGPKGMEEIVGHDMELVSLEDHEAALQQTRRAALLEAAQVIPRNWLDPLLKGVRTSSCPEIEQLLQSIKAEIDRLAQEG